MYVCMYQHGIYREVSNLSDNLNRKNRYCIVVETQVLYLDNLHN